MDLDFAMTDNGEMNRLLIANRGEIAVRVARAAAELGIRTISVYSQDDARSMHVVQADEALALPGNGARAYLDLDELVRLAVESGADAVHPGYGFLSESAAFAAAIEAAGVKFVGPTPENLALFGDKVRARGLAAECDVPVLTGTTQAVSAEEARDFFETLGANGQMVIKAVSGGGGRGMRVVRAASEVDDAHTRAASEAEAAFGDSQVYVEEYLPRARHIEVQILGDGSGAISHFGERECSIQRRHQKIVEIAPSPSLEPALRKALTEAALKLGASVRYRGLGTMEFLLDSDGKRFSFIEANARLQVEHTVTEEVCGESTSCQLQLEIARWAHALTELSL